MNTLALIEATIEALHKEMQYGNVDPVDCNHILTQLTYIKFQLKDKQNENSSKLLKTV